MKNLTLFLFVFTALAAGMRSQDTFSIVAADSVTREVGSAGASCVDLFQFGIADASFLGDLLPDTGAINSQAAYVAGNQTNARIRMRAGDDPAQVVAWLMANDVGGNSSTRQYGVVGFTGANVSAAGFTGTNCMNYKNHVTGSINGIYYSIQGNILLGQLVLDSMEQRFRSAQGDLACRLMAALQGAKMVGADTRCATNNTSSLFAFLKVAQPTDAYGNPSFIVTVKTNNNDSIEPIDTLQTLFDMQRSCLAVGANELAKATYFRIYPNPAANTITVFADASLNGTAYTIRNSLGQVVLEGKFSGVRTPINIQSLAKGVYFMHSGNLPKLKFIKQ